MTSLTELISIDQTANKQRHSVEESTITPRTVQALTETCSLGDLDDAILSRHGDKANKLLTMECFTKAVHTVEHWDICQVADSNCQYDPGTHTCSTNTLQGHEKNIEDDDSVLFVVGVRIKQKQCFTFYFYTYIGILVISRLKKKIRMAMKILAAPPCGISSSKEYYQITTTNYQFTLV